ncbi:cytidine deaminase [Chondromyces apiculatus]|uniref:Cytidine deaminase n=1 Tax=Chondromyces apiculatus DSM 436 TaxID=1192034 RepID=A0A017TJ60_9BACT|nr:cytidine deaminase [Chondromyces apiculatus]EYF08646.1 Cytidine deaminase [Chondromyces apiculatus DSM 436]
MSTGERQSPGWEELAAAALEVRRRAYAPYSGYQVGAALRVRSGRVFTGCNVENATYGLTVCAERSAVLQMIAAGEKDPVAVVVATRGPVAAAPCGMCRQTLAEFAVDLHIRLIAAPVEGEETPTPRDTSLAELLPQAFRGDALA